MTVNELLSKLPSEVNVRVNVAGVVEVCGTTGYRNTAKITRRLSDEGGGNAEVASIYPLWHARELYIGALR